MSEKYPYRHFSYHKNPKSNSVYGVATFSKFPIVGKNKIEYFSDYNNTTYSDIDVNGKVIRLFNCHFESNRLSLDDKKKMKELVGEDINQNKLKTTTGLLGRKLGAAYVKRAFQADVVADEIARSPYPVIVCGDFNDTPVSYTYSRIRGDLADAFTETSTGMGISYNEFPFWFRIDYIFHNPQFRAGNFKVDRVEYSDHYPISCDLQIEN
jgi:endonuclease/exonuclease/phosphatase family metal-dependent hydrolase